ncbi:mycothiol synthase [Arthrobacter sp. 35W]|uniref:mycothiol synthase n=1 Tax=Arthrobacter sp. 35W TaxID=1132441 RepID=UPI00047ACF49|nr:mycothiol synthase [Arthrobacter sp. 35W]
MSPAKTENWPVVVGGGAPDPQLRRDIDALVAAAAEADGNPPLSEQTLVELRSGGGTAVDVLTLATYAPEDHSDPATAADLAGIAVVVSHEGAGVLEVVVHPTYRNQGVGALLVDALKAHRGLANLTAWSHGNHEAAADLAARYGFGAIRELWRMRLARPAAGAPALEPAELPDGVTLRTFVPGQDEDAWLAANAAAFAHHPEQGSMTAADLRARMDEPWFDPAGFFLATRAGDGGSERILGFHWTKVHAALGQHPAMGEVYVVGVAPEAQGLGLGKALTVAGIRHLQQAGLAAIMLYVDADNTAAVALYRKLGFTRWDADVMYGPTPS